MFSLRLILATLLFALALSGCAVEQEFPDHIPRIKNSLGRLVRAVAAREAAILDSACTDQELYRSVTHILGADSLAILSRRIQNPIDSAHVIMTVAARNALGELSPDRYNLELFLKRRGDVYWIVAHRLTNSPP